jgi:hypothetical protein
MCTKCFHVYIHLYKCLHVCCICVMSYILFILMLRTCLTCTSENFGSHARAVRSSGNSCMLGFHLLYACFVATLLLYSEDNITMCLNMQTLSTKQVQDLQTILPIIQTEPKTSSQVQTFPSWATSTELRLRCFRRHRISVTHVHDSSYKVFKHFTAHLHIKDVILSCPVIQQSVLQKCYIHISCNLSLYPLLFGCFKLLPSQPLAYPVLHRPLQGTCPHSSL